MLDFVSMLSFIAVMHMCRGISPALLIFSYTWALERLYAWLAGCVSMTALRIEGIIFSVKGRLVYQKQQRAALEGVCMAQPHVYQSFI